VSPIIAALQGLAALPKLVDQIGNLVDRLGSIERQMNEKKVIERMAVKRSRNAAAIQRVLASSSGSGGGTDKSPPV
tara:strand:+ start:233 stop:460 length:228 start_codon:yes stop_codon:yes gene_type:complete